MCCGLFLSTPSARRATRQLSRWNSPSGISIHALREEGDISFWATMSGIPAYFYPRPPRGGRRVRLAETEPGVLISIHALREEGDFRNTQNPIIHSHFYPRPPRGGRPRVDARIQIPFQRFLSTPSARRATVSIGSQCMTLTISIHALREEGDA